MTTPTITLYPDTLPAKGQANAPFDTNVDDFLSWLTATNGPELATFITWTVGVRDTVLATALAGDLPPLTGEATKFLRVNAAEDGAEFRTPAEVLGDIGATAALALKAPLASPDLTGNPTAPTQTAGNNSTRLATTEFVQDYGKQSGTLVATTSGTAFDFTSIPVEVQEIEILFHEVSLSGTDQALVQLGTSGGVVSTGYASNSIANFNTGSGSGVSSTTGFILRLSDSAVQLTGILTLRRLQSGSNVWVATHTASTATTIAIIGGGTITLGAEIDRVRITRTGTDTFDAGQLNVRWK
jgi:hypothetical protein